MLVQACFAIKVKASQACWGSYDMKTALELTGTDLLSLNMDLNDSEQRLNILDCLRENATNMRIEQQRIRDRISAAIVQARINLYQIRKLNDELNEMKESVGSALLLSEADQDRFLNEVEQQYAIKADEDSQQDEQLDEGQLR